LAPSAAVQATEGSEVSEANVDGATQAGKIASVAGHVDLSLQALEWSGPDTDAALAQDLGKAIGSAIDVQLVAGSNSSGQTLGLANVTGIKTVSWTDASPTSAEFVGQCWEGYDQIANGGEGIADPDNYIVVMHPRRLAWAYNNVQNAQVIPPGVPGRIVACAGLRINLGAGTNEDEVGGKSSRRQRMRGFAPPRQPLPRQTFTFLPGEKISFADALGNKRGTGGNSFWESKTRQSRQGRRESETGPGLPLPRSGGARRLTQVALRCRCRCHAPPRRRLE
jgi:hypothetical protein